MTKFTSVDKSTIDLSIHAAKTTMTNTPDPSQPVDMQALIRLIESNAKAIEAAGNQQAADRDLARSDRELNRQSREETREDIRQLAALLREDRERSQIQERQIRMQAGEIQNLADSIQVLYSRQPPSS